MLAPFIQAFFGDGAGSAAGGSNDGHIRLSARHSDYVRGTIRSFNIRDIPPSTAWVQQCLGKDNTVQKHPKRERDGVQAGAEDRFLEGF